MAWEGGVQWAVNIPRPSPEEYHVDSIFFLMLGLLGVTFVRLLTCSMACSFSVCKSSTLYLNLLCMVYFTYLDTWGGGWVLISLWPLNWFYTALNTASLSWLLMSIGEAPVPPALTGACTFKAPAITPRLYSSMLYCILGS